MRKNKIIKLLMYLPLILAIFSYFFLDNKIPSHYDLNGNITRWGNKIEIFIIPIFTIIFGYYLIWMNKITKRNNPEKNLEISKNLSIISILIFNIINVIVIYFGFKKNEKMSSKFLFLIIIVLIAIFYYIFHYKRQKNNEES